VLCVECFRASEHRTHNYSMTTSAGGGCCDCGDAEAWTNFPCCKTHDPTAAKTVPQVCGAPFQLTPRFKFPFPLGCVWLSCPVAERHHNYLVDVPVATQVLC
jgi:hypothetical protein